MSYQLQVNDFIIRSMSYEELLEYTLENYDEWSDNESLKMQLEDYECEMARLESKIDSLNYDVDCLEQDCSSYRSDIEDLESEISDLQNKIDNMELDKDIAEHGGF